MLLLRDFIKDQERGRQTEQRTAESPREYAGRPSSRPAGLVRGLRLLRGHKSSYRGSYFVVTVVMMMLVFPTVTLGFERQQDGRRPAGQRDSTVTRVWAARCSPPKAGCRHRERAECHRERAPAQGRSQS